MWWPLAGNFELWNGNTGLLPPGLHFLAYDLYPKAKATLDKSHVEYMEALVGSHHMGVFGNLPARPAFVEARATGVVSASVHNRQAGNSSH